MLRAPSPGRGSPPCFNEAEARAPRMRRAEIERCRRSPGFNEAEARAPRMQAPGGKLMTAPATASMRPRRARLGCSPSKYRLSAKSQSFNEAEARASDAPDGQMIVCYNLAA